MRGFGGVILQGSPSLCLVAFGLPQTLEQLPQRAIQAALAIRHLAAEVQASLEQGTSPVVRLGGHVGTLLVAEEAGGPPWRWLAVGETLALPVRPLGHAAPGELLVSAPIARLTDGWVEVQTRPLSSRAEPSEPLLAHTVVRLLPQHPCSRGEADGPPRPSSGGRTSWPPAGSAGSGRKRPGAGRGDCGRAWDGQVAAPGRMAPSPDFARGHLPWKGTVGPMGARRPTSPCLTYCSHIAASRPLTAPKPWL